MPVKSSRVPAPVSLATRALAPVARTRDALVSVANSMIAGVAGHHTELFGDALPRSAWRLDARDVSAAALLQAHGDDAHGAIDVAVYVHGLFIDESNWALGPTPLPTAVQRTFGWAPLFVRYNSGRHVSQSGEDLAALLEELAATWGPRLGRIAIFGHSMGGLVCRSALHVLEKRGASVLGRIDRLFLLAVPNQGADLERLGHAIEFGLTAIDLVPTLGRRLMRRADVRSGRRGARRRNRPAREPSAVVALPSVPLRTIRAIFAFRSDGIRDVRFGYMTQAEWESEAHDRFRFMLNHRRPLPPPPGIRVYCIAGSLWPDVGSAPSRIRNDGLVSTASAAGKGGEFDDLGVVEQGRFAEIPLLLHQVVPASARAWVQIRRWVEDDV